LKGGNDEEQQHTGYGEETEETQRADSKRDQISKFVQNTGTNKDKDV